MRTTDVNAFKGQMKTAIQNWLGRKVDEIFPNKAQTRVIAKNAINNGLNRMDERLNGYIDTLFILFADESGTIDSDTLVNGIASLLDEMKADDYAFGPFNVTVGAGEIAVHFPHNAFVEMIAGDLGGVRITSSDIKEMKNLFNV